MDQRVSERGQGGGFDRGLFAMWLGLSALFVTVYWDIWYVWPSADDFGPPLTDARIGFDSMAKLVGETRQAFRIRPLQSLAYHLLARMSGTGRDVTDPRLFLAIHAAGLAAYILYIGIVLRLSRRFLSRTGTLVAGVVCVLHPVAVASVASIDGLSSLGAALCIWVGIFWLLEKRDQSTKGMILVSSFLVIGFFLKEYVLALFPVGVAFGLFLGKGTSPIRRALPYALGLGFATLAAFALREWFYPNSFAAAGGGLLSLPRLSFNLGLIALGLSFVGDSSSVATERTPQVLGMAALVWVAFVLPLTIGITRQLRKSDALGRRTIAFFGSSLVLATFPELLVMRMSEMYIGVSVAALAVLSGLAAEGLLDIRRTFPKAPALLGIVALLLTLTSAHATRAKVQNMVDSGQLAHKEAQALLSALPNNARDAMVHVFWDQRQQLHPNYSVYRTGEIVAIHSSFFFHYFVEERSLGFSGHMIRSDEELSKALSRLHEGELAFLWSQTTQQFAQVH